MQCSLTLSVRFSERVHKICVTASNAPDVSCLRRTVHAELGVPPQNQVLVFLGKVLPVDQDGQLLSDFGIKDGSAIMLTESKSAPASATSTSTTASPPVSQSQTQLNELTDQCRTILRQRNIKLWEPPFTITADANAFASNTTEINQLARSVSYETKASVGSVIEALEYLRAHSLVLLHQRKIVAETHTQDGRNGFSVKNVANGQSFSRPLVRLIGTCPLELSSIFVTVGSSQVEWPCRNGEFKAVVHLAKTGQTVVTVSSIALPAKMNILAHLDFLRSKTLCFGLSYSRTRNVQAQKSGLFVRLCYLCPADCAEGSFICPVEYLHANENCLTAACQRIAFTALLWQTFCADDLEKQGFGPDCTFEVEVDEKSNPPLPKVHQIVSRLTTEEILRLGDNWSDGGGKGYEWASSEITDSLPSAPNAITVCIISSTRLCEDGKVVGHTALGGGNLALFGSGGIFSWPASVADIPLRMTDTTPLSTLCSTSDSQPGVFDDSAGRGQVWAQCATTVGAVMHELGHCFGLLHTSFGIMARGFDYFNRFFVDSNLAFSDHQMADVSLCTWHPSSAVALAHCPHFVLPELQGQPQPQATSNSDPCRWDKVGGGCFVRLLWRNSTVIGEIPVYLWFEVDENGRAQYLFHQVEIVSDWGHNVIILDKSRSMYVKLSEGGASWSSHGNYLEGWHFICSGSWAPKPIEGQATRYFVKSENQGFIAPIFPATTWVEVVAPPASTENANPSFFSFAERQFPLYQQDRDSVLLHDSSRGLSVRLSKHEFFFGAGEAPTAWHKLGNGTMLAVLSDGTASVVDNTTPTLPHVRPKIRQIKLQDSQGARSLEFQVDTSDQVALALAEVHDANGNVVFFEAHPQPAGESTFVLRGNTSGAQWHAVRVLNKQCGTWSDTVNIPQP